MTSIFCGTFIGIKLIILHSVWAVVPFIYAFGMLSSPTTPKENMGDVILNCAPIGVFYL